MKRIKSTVNLDFQPVEVWVGKKSITVVSRGQKVMVCKANFISASGDLSAVPVLEGSVLIENVEFISMSEAVRIILWRIDTYRRLGETASVATHTDFLTDFVQKVSSGIAGSVMEANGFLNERCEPNVKGDGIFHPTEADKRLLNIYTLVDIHDRLFYNKKGMSEAKRLETICFYCDGMKKLSGDRTYDTIKTLLTSGAGSAFDLEDIRSKCFQSLTRLFDENPKPFLASTIRNRVYAAKKMPLARFNEIVIEPLVEQGLIKYEGEGKLHIIPVL